MQHPHEVDIVKAVLGSQKIVVYGEDLLRHRVAEGETTRTTVAEIPIGRPESAAVLKHYFAQCERHLGQGARCRTADSSPGAGHSGRPTPHPGVSTHRADALQHEGGGGARR